MSNWFFHAPANMTDFKDPQSWHDEMVGLSKYNIKVLVALALNKSEDDITQADIEAMSPQLSYVNPVDFNPPETADVVNIAPWGGFPRAVDKKAPWPFPNDPGDINGSYRAVEHQGQEDIGDDILKDDNGKLLNLPVRDRQDEYLEWVVRRNPEGKIIKAIFVAEGYDYYSSLFKYDEQAVVDLYRKFTGVTSIVANDLRAVNGIGRYTSSGAKRETIAESGAFNPRNKFNLEPGIVHLSHNANALGAEVNLAAVSALARMTITGVTLQPGAPEKLLCCSQGGNPNRNSDPLIGDQAYAQVMGKFKYTLADPVGLYIAGAETQRITTDKGEAIPLEWWKVVRGQDLWTPGHSRVLRLELEVPSELDFVLGDLLIDGNPIKYPGQIARLMSVHLFVTRWKRTDNSIGPIVNCSGTCCRKIGTDQLQPTTHKCTQGFELAFPDLIPQEEHLKAEIVNLKTKVNTHAGTGRYSRKYSRGF